MLHTTKIHMLRVAMMMFIHLSKHKVCNYVKKRACATSRDHIHIQGIVFLLTLVVIIFKANSSQHVEHLAYLPPNCWSASYQGIASATSTRSWKRLATPNSKPRDQISMTVLLLHVPRREREGGRGPQVLLRPTRCRRPFPAHLIQRRVSDSQ